MKIAVIDYGMGNIHSVAKALQVCGARVSVTEKSEELGMVDKIILPGVGAFDDAMERLNQLGLSREIIRQAQAGKPLLGICLGMQLLLEKSEEAGVNRGLALVKGEVVKFSSKSGVKIPHMGWNELKIIQRDCPLLDGVKDKDQVYFCHSFYPQPPQNLVSAVSDYGREFCCILRSQNVYGVQFHPEKSQAVGLKIIQNFVQRC